MSYKLKQLGLVCTKLTEFSQQTLIVLFKARVFRPWLTKRCSY